MTRGKEYGKKKKTGKYNKSTSKKTVRRGGGRKEEKPVTNDVTSRDGIMCIVRYNLRRQKKKKKIAIKLAAGPDRPR